MIDVHSAIAQAHPTCLTAPLPLTPAWTLILALLMLHWCRGPSLGGCSHGGVHAGHVGGDTCMLLMVCPSGPHCPHGG